MERGSIVIYDNGIILSQGAGGAALHYYTFGKIDADKVEFVELEKIEEEYFEGDDTPLYRELGTYVILEYKSLDEIMDKYVSGSKEIEL